MRGKVAAPRQPCGAARITPACAGKRHHPEPGQSSSEDHPRMCGEKISVRPIRTGSPPPVRGKAGFPVRCREHSRITPACAGKSKSRPSSSSSSWDHPCVCGEKTKPVPAGGILMGSPPPVRGKVRKDSRSKAPCWDHPRVCGEKDMVLAMVRFVWGSPPRVRGKGGISGDCFFCPRITPACAGKRPGWADSGCQRGDHPRVCGEKRGLFPAALSS